MPPQPKHRTGTPSITTHSTAGFARSSRSSDQVYDAEAIDQLLDCPAEGDGRVFVIGSALRIDELDALLADYKEQAADLGHCPMSREALQEKLARGCRQEEAIS